MGFKALASSESGLRGRQGKKDGELTLEEVLLIWRLLCAGRAICGECSTCGWLCR